MSDAQALEHSRDVMFAVFMFVWLGLFALVIWFCVELIAHRADKTQRDRDSKRER